MGELAKGQLWANSTSPLWLQALTGKRASFLLLFLLGILAAVTWADNDRFLSIY